MRQITLSLAVVTLISGCAFHTKPFVAYEGSAPLSETSVFSSGGGSGISLGQIPKVNGKETSCWQAGCPVWVRVKPGKNTFTVRYSIFDNGIASHLQGEADLEIPDMQPRHVYQAEYEVLGNKFRLTYKDLGENPDFGVTLGLDGVNKKYNRVQF